MIGEVLEGQMQTFVRPVPVEMGVDDYVDLDFFGEVSIEVVLDDGHRKAVLVPKRDFDEESRMVRGMAIGKRPESNRMFVFVTFSPTQDGQATLEVPEDQLKEIKAWM